MMFNPKYAGFVYKVTVAIDSLGNVVCICPLAPGTSALRPSLFTAFRILHDVLCGGKVACI